MGESPINPPSLNHPHLRRGSKEGVCLPEISLPPITNTHAIVHVPYPGVLNFLSHFFYPAKAHGVQRERKIPIMTSRTTSPMEWRLWGAGEGGEGFLKSCVPPHMTGREEVIPVLPVTQGQPSPSLSRRAHAYLFLGWPCSLCSLFSESVIQVQSAPAWKQLGSGSVLDIKVGKIKAPRLVRGEGDGSRVMAASELIPWCRV